MKNNKTESFRMVIFLNKLLFILTDKIYVYYLYYEQYLIVSKYSY